MGQIKVFLGRINVVKVSHPHTKFDGYFEDGVEVLQVELIVADKQLSGYMTLPGARVFADELTHLTNNCQPSSGGHAVFKLPVSPLDEKLLELSIWYSQKNNECKGKFTFGGGDIIEINTSELRNLADEIRATY